MVSTVTIFYHCSVSTVDGDVRAAALIAAVGNIISVAALTTGGAGMGVSEVLHDELEGNRGKGQLNGGQGWLWNGRRRRGHHPRCRLVHLCRRQRDAPRARAAREELVQPALRAGAQR